MNFPTWRRYTQLNLLCLLIVLYCIIIQLIVSKLRSKTLEYGSLCENK